jgi:hypothetical protein
MNEQGSARHRELRGTIRRRLLVNAVVDPDEAATRLPPGVRPHVAGGGTVVGCCLLDVEHVRPAGVPASAGRTLRAAAHRISVDWEDATGAPVTGVYVPLRHSDSRAAIALGGRWFPGVHERARIAITASGSRLRWVSHPVGAADRLGIRVAVSGATGAAAGEGDPVGQTCLSALVGLSPDHRGVLEAARMEPVRLDARAVTVEILDSAFLDGFSTARPATSYLMRDVDVRWTPAGVPAAAPAVVS